jgi:hypothetical protein
MIGCRFRQPFLIEIVIKHLSLKMILMGLTNLLSGTQYDDLLTVSIKMI